MKDLGQRIIVSIMSLIFPAIIILFLPSIASASLVFYDSKQFNTIDEAVQWQKDILVIASKYQIDSIKTGISIQSPPTVSYSVKLKPLTSGLMLYPEKREFNGQQTPDSAFQGYWIGIIVDGGFALLVMGALLYAAWTDEEKNENS